MSNARPVHVRPVLAFTSGTAQHVPPGSPVGFGVGLPTVEE